jgi:exonuclease III
MDGTKHIQEKGMLYYSCHKKLHQFGMGFIVNKRTKHLFVDCQPVNWRICKLRIRGRFHNYSLICVHGPTEDKNENQKYSFYKLLEKEYDKCPKNDIKLIIGDFNAKTGQEHKLKPTIRRHSLHKDFKDNGMRPFEYAVSRNMVIGSTKFLHRNVHKITWKSPDGDTFNQIDHILIDATYRSSLLDV